MINSGWCVGSGCTTTRRRGGMIDVGGCSWGPHPRRLVVLPGLEPWCPPRHIVSSELAFCWTALAPPSIHHPTTPSLHQVLGSASTSPLHSVVISSRPVCVD